MNNISNIENPKVNSCCLDKNCSKLNLENNPPNEDNKVENKSEIIPSILIISEK